MEEPVIQRATVIAIILAILFGILQLIPQNKTYDSVTIETILKIISTPSIMGLVLFPFLIYFLFIAINLGYGMNNIISQKILRRVYNTGILLSFYIIFLIVSFGLIFDLIILLSISVKVATYLFILFLILFIITFAIIFNKFVW